MNDYHDYWQKISEITNEHHNLYLQHCELMKQADKQSDIMDKILCSNDIKFFYELWIGHKYKDAKKEFNKIIEKAKQIEEQQKILLDRFSELELKENEK